MKKILLFIFTFFTFLSINAQSYFGYLNDNYSGVHAVINNPANIVDSRFKTDINIGSASLLYTNNYFANNINDLFRGKDLDESTDKTPSSSNSFLVNTDVLGPSFMFNIKPKHAVAFFSRGRVINHLTNLDGRLIEDFNSRTSNTNYDIKDQNFSVATNGWAEYGVSYATILYDKEQHFLKGGLSLKYLTGFYSAFAKVENFGIKYTDGPTGDSSFYNTTGTIESGNIKSFDNYDSPANIEGYGVGFDIGLTYEYRPNAENFKYKDKEGKEVYYKDKNKYLYRLGLSVTDFGSIRYNDAISKSYNANAFFTQTQSNNAGFDNYTLTGQSSSIISKMPTALHLNADWNFHKNFYLNLNTDLSLIKNTATNAAYITNNVGLTPRFEVKWFSAYLPMNYLKYSGFQAGFGFRAGPLFVGSGTVISGLIGKTQALDGHIGLKIPIYQGKLKDRDFDGIKNRKDDCPEVAGPIENKGCPWKDSDSDSIIDNEDKCPNVAGDKANSGCPWGDLDKDTVLDNVDKCPEVVGDSNNNGCPWGDSDKDGLTDNIDKCPLTFGVLANNGCPEEIKKVVEVPVIKDEIIKKINDFSKTILFDTGKATLKPESNTSLDNIVLVLNEFPTSNFKVEGHTDSSGKPENNLKLSQERANTVMNYFITKGISPSRLTATGYGSTQPITSNATVDGKNKNRRVEINLVK